MVSHPSQLNTLSRLLFVSLLVSFYTTLLYAQKDSLTESGRHYELKGITVKGHIPQIVQSKDTAIINPDAYHTPKEAYLKDLVKRIPGLVYDEKTGDLSFNGQRIREVNVNGKPFFSGNTQVPVENLPLKFVSRLKIYKRQNDEEKALGIRSGKEFYVLDLITKKEMNKTFMNSAVAGMGNLYKKQFELHSDYFESSGNNLSFHATTGNRYMTDLYKGSTNNSISLNATRRLKDGLTLTGNLQYNLNKSGNDNSTYMERYLKDNNDYTVSQNTGRQQSRSFNGYTNLNWEIDKKTQLTLTATYNYTNSLNSSESLNGSTGTALKDMDIQQPFVAFNALPDSMKINKSRTISSSSSHGYNYDVGTSFIRRLNTKGTTLSLNFRHSLNHNKSRETTENTTTFYRLQNQVGNDSLFVQNLLKQSPASNHNLQAGLTFVQPLTKRLKLQLSYTYQDNLDKSTNHTSGTPPGKTGYEYVDSLSGYSSSKAHSHLMELVLNYTSDTWNMYLNGALIPGTRSIKRHLNNLTTDTLSAVMDFRTSLHIERTNNNRTLAFDYNASSTQPDLISLVPLTDNSDPLNISRGNPALKPTYNHNWNLSYNAFTKGITFNLSFNLTQNAVTQATYYNVKTGGRESYPVNINGNMGGNAYLRWWKTLGKFNLSAMGSSAYSRTASLLNESDELRKNNTQSLYTSTNIQATYNPSWGGISLSEMYTYNYTVSSLQKTGNFTHTLNSSFNAFADLPFGLSLQTDFMLTLRTGDNIPSKEKTQTMWNASATYRFLKEKRMEVSLVWHDILNHSRMYYRTSTSSGFYESYSPQIRSYVMLTLKYRFQIMK